MSTELVNVAGTTDLNNVTKFRTANDLAFRTKQFMRAGQTDIQLVELPQPMTKVDAARYCLTHEKFADVKYQIALNKFLGVEQAPAIMQTKVDLTKKAPEAPVIKEEAEEHTATKLDIKELMPVLEADDDYGDLLEMAGFTGDNDLFAMDDY